MTWRSKPASTELSVSSTPKVGPSAGARIKLQAHVSNLSPPQPAAEFLVESLRPNEIRPLLAFHEERKLAGHVEIKANEQGIAELKLQPWATLLGRLVDETGEARTGIVIEQLDRDVKPVTTDSQGRFRIEGLVPGKAVADVWVSPVAGTCRELSRRAW